MRWSFLKSQGCKQGAQLFLASFLFLFLEIAFIRWISGYVKIVAYFTNIILISAFLGGGIGLLAHKRNYRNFFPVFIFILVFSAFAYNIAYGAATQGSAGDSIAPPQNFDSSSPHQKSILGRIFLPEGEWIWNTSTILIYLVPVFFILTALVFIPIGQILGEKMKHFRPLKAYTIDIAGSLTGILCLSLLSLLSIQPFWWFLLGLALYIPFLEGKKARIAGIAFFVASLAIIGILGTGTQWSPYYKIIMEPPNQYGEFTLTVNDDSILYSKNFQKGQERGSDGHYALPYLFKTPERLLIVGAGTGNDAYIATLHSVKEIDAVEIDPLIISFGSIHPNKPYSYGNVHVILNDARNYIKTTDKEYDMIIYGLLDSHRVFSHQSSVRLDNFVYTREAMEEAKRTLAPGGVVVLSFWVGKDFIETKIYHLLRDAFKMDPVVIQTGNVKTFIVGNIDSSHLPTGLDYTQIKDTPVIVPSDNYPFLYLKNRLEDTSYLRILVLVFMITLLMLMLLTSGIRSVSWHFFFLGTGFLLIETKSITEMALMFGSTWIVNSFVIGGILTMILFANYFVAKVKANLKALYLLLGCSLLLNFLIQPSSFLHNSLLSKIAGILVISLPVLFAGIIFATSFKGVKNIPIAFGSNILGAVLGGAFEYSSLVFGIKTLYIIAFATYLLSYFCIRK